jgi:hypothetical protein
VHEIVGRINGRFGSVTFVPIHHLASSSAWCLVPHFVSFSCTFFAALCFMWKMNSKLEEEKKLGGWMVRSNVSSSFRLSDLKVQWFSDGSVVAAGSVSCIS